MKTILALWSVLLTVASAFAAEPSAPLRYWSDTWRGWHFYEEPEPEFEHRAPPPLRPARSRSKPLPNRPAELIEFERLQKTLEEARHIAVMRPTEANVRRYMELEAQVVARASTFADMAQRIAWTSPELDPTLQGRPVNAKALEVFDQLQMAQRSESIAALGRDHVLLFFFRGDCPYCHTFAPTLQAFQARHGIRVVAVSVDGGSMPGFADARRDNGISRTLQVSQVPAVYLAQPFTGVITPIGFGVLSEAQLLERIAIVGTAPTAGGTPLANR
jgi:conjugal transfer pilus assembly protein TraF